MSLVTPGTFDTIGWLLFDLLLLSTNVSFSNAVAAAKSSASSTRQQKQNKTV